MDMTTTPRQSISSVCPLLKTFLLSLQRRTWLDEQAVIRNANGERYYVTHIGGGILECLTGGEVFNFELVDDLLAFING